MNNKYFILSLVLASIACALPAQSLVVTSPNGGETLTLGQTVQIAWTASNVDQKVRLQLIKSGGALVGLIAGNLNPAPSFFSWTVGQYDGGTAPADGNYRIRIRTVDGALEDVSNNAFTISPGANPPPPAGLNVNTPPALGIKPPTVPDIVPYAVITSFTVNGQAASGVRYKCFRSQGILCQAKAFSKTKPVLFRYSLSLITSDNYEHMVFTSPWSEQSAYTIMISQDAVLNAVFPNGNFSMIPISLLGRVTLEARNATQSEPPQRSAIGIQFYL